MNKDDASTICITNIYNNMDNTTNIDINSIGTILPRNTGKYDSITENNSVYSCTNANKYIDNGESEDLSINLSRDHKNAIYRYKFTQEFMDELYQFSKIHQYDDRIGFKEAWLLWVENNIQIVDTEVSRLTNIGYHGDILDKMFKSARYYFRKKGTKKKEPCERRSYISVQKELLDAMDSHIAENIFKNDYKPSDGFTDFCNSNKNILNNGIVNLVEQGMKEVDLIKDKIKKTYKNRYFMAMKK